MLSPGQKQSLSPSHMHCEETETSEAVGTEVDGCSQAWDGYRHQKKTEIMEMPQLPICPPLFVTIEMKLNLMTKPTPHLMFTNNLMPNVGTNALKNRLHYGCN